MKKAATLGLMLLLMMVLVACGGGQTTSEDAGAGTGTEAETKQESGGLFKKAESIEGEWVTKPSDEEYTEYLTVDGDSVLLETWGGMSFKGEVNKSDSTIAFERDYEDTPLICEYEVIGSKLVLTGEELATRTFEKKEE